MKPLSDIDLSRVLREPLFHFLLIGAAIFGFYSFISVQDVGASPDRIVVSSGDIQRFAGLWEKRWQRRPTAEELKGLVEEYVREEVLYREAMALGLDRDDTVIRRLLRQKFEFVTQDLAIASEPDAAVLSAFYRANRERYRTPARLSFSQIFFNLDRRGAAGEQDARLALATLRDETGDNDLAGLGDGTMLNEAYSNMPVQDVELRFGSDFSDALSRLEPGVWSGPIRSEYGIHLVRLDSRSAGRVPPFFDIEDRVRTDWAHEQRQQANEAIYRRLLARYEVIVEGADLGEAHSLTSEIRR